MAVIITIPTTLPVINLNTQSIIDLMTVIVPGKAIKKPMAANMDISK